MVHKVTDLEFNDLLKSQEKIVVKYFANWCGSCRLFAPKFTKLSNKEEFRDIHFIEVNAEENPKARELAKVTNLPFFATFKNGQLENTLSASKEEAVASLLATLYI